jgi:hypothetical protein
MPSCHATHIYIVGFIDGQATSPEFYLPEPQEYFYLVDNPRPLGCLQIKWVRTLKNALLSNDVPTEFAKLHEVAVDPNQRFAV